MNHLVKCVAVPLLLTAATPAQALLVPTQYATIAAALAAAPAGATILVAPGVYAENLTWPNRDGIRLIGEAGAAATIIDGGGSGRVITFGSGLTRATLLQGFTIQNGALATSQNFGAGIYVYRVSPTIRNNRITANTNTGQRNYGGGIHVSGSGADPRIEGNEIFGNEQFDGAWNYGAGIYVGLSAQAEIVANVIHDNHNGTINPVTTNRGHGAGVFCDGTATIASNFVFANTNDTNGWNYGGGIKVGTSGTATILNNTIVGNTVVNGIWRYGGGVHVEGGSDATLRGNVIVFNQGHGIYVGSGTGGVIGSDHDDVFGNSAADYSGLAAGSNSISLDPLFVSATDFHLQAGSPCVDAMPSTWLTTAVATDVDGDPRRIDGDLDGGVTDGARLDLGADELTSVRLDVPLPALLGTTINWSIASAQPAVQLFAVGFTDGLTFMPPYGELLLGSGAVFVGVGPAPGTWPFAVPNIAGLRGTTILGQALVLLTTGPGGQFTNAARITVH